MTANETRLQQIGAARAATAAVEQATGQGEAILVGMSGCFLPPSATASARRAARELSAAAASRLHSAVEAALLAGQAVREVAPDAAAACSTAATRGEVLARRIATEQSRLALLEAALAAVDAAAQPFTEAEGATLDLELILRSATRESPDPPTPDEPPAPDSSVAVPRFQATGKLLVSAILEMVSTGRTVEAFAPHAAAACSAAVKRGHALLGRMRAVKESFAAIPGHPSIQALEADEMQVDASAPAAVRIPPLSQRQRGTAFARSQEIRRGERAPASAPTTRDLVQLSASHKSIGGTKARAGRFSATRPAIKLAFPLVKTAYPSDRSTPTTPLLLSASHLVRTAAARARCKKAALKVRTRAPSPHPSAPSPAAPPAAASPSPS